MPGTNKDLPRALIDPQGRAFCCRQAVLCVQRPRISEQHHAAECGQYGHPSAFHRFSSRTFHFLLECDLKPQVADSLPPPANEPLLRISGATLAASRALGFASEPLSEFYARRSQPHARSGSQAEPLSEFYARRSQPHARSGSQANPTLLFLVRRLAVPDVGELHRRVRFAVAVIFGWGRLLEQ